MEPADRKIAKFLKASSELEQYLHEDGHLTPLEHQTIQTTIMGLQTLMQAWTRKHRGEGMLTRSPVTPQKAKGS